MAGSQPRPRVELEIHDDHSHNGSPTVLGTTTTAALGELPLGSVQNIRRTSTSVDSLTRQLGNFHIHGTDKENKSRSAARAGSAQRLPVSKGARDTAICGHSEGDFSNNNPLALASRELASAREQLSKHQEGQFEWLLSIPVRSSARGRRPRADSHDDAELRQGEKTLYFGCNLVHRRSQSSGAIGENARATDVYTLLATRIRGEEDFAADVAAVMEMEREAINGSLQGGLAAPAERGGGGRPEMVKNGELAVEPEALGPADGAASDSSSRPASRIEDSVEALDKFEEDIEALTEVAQIDRVLSPEVAKGAQQSTKPAGAATTPLKRTTSVRPGADSVRDRAAERSSPVRKSDSTTSTKEDGPAAAGTAASSTRAVPRPASLLPPKPPAKSSKPPTVPAFELPGEAVARRLKEQREQRRSQQITPEQAAALAAAYSPSKPHFKSSKPPTRPTFELPGEAISRKKREEREAKLRAQEEEERKRREFKARPIRASLVPSSVPRETLASLARQKSRQLAEASSDSTATTITPASKKRHSMAALSSSSASAGARATPTPEAIAANATTLPSRGRPLGKSNANNDSNSTTATNAPASRATSTSAASCVSVSSSSRPGASRSTVSAEEVAQQKLRGKEVVARDNSYAAARERERREREEAARRARQEAAERSRMLSREWAEKQRAAAATAGKTSKVGTASKAGPGAGAGAVMQQAQQVKV